MKKNKKIILLAVLILLFSFIAFIGGGSFSRYITQVNGSSVIEVAKWAFAVNDETETIGNIDLAQTCDASTLVDGQIAPGTSGSFDITIDATGAEVGIQYEISFPREGSAPKNFIYSTNGHTSNTLEGLQQYLTDIIPANDTNRTRTITINWEWPFEPETEDENEIKESNKKDTHDGEHLVRFEFDIVIAGKQVAPEAI